MVKHVCCGNYGESAEGVQLVGTCQLMGYADNIVVVVVIVIVVVIIIIIIIINYYYVKKAIIKGNRKIPSNSVKVLVCKLPQGKLLTVQSLNIFRWLCLFPTASFLGINNLMAAFSDALQYQTPLGH